MDERETQHRAASSEGGRLSQSEPRHRRTRRTFLRSGAVAGLAVAGGCGRLGSKGSQPWTILGAYPGTNPTRRATFGPVERWLGRRHAVVVCYVDAGGESPAIIERFVDGLTRLWESGHVPMVTWQPRPRTPEERRNLTRTIERGNYDAVVDRWAERLAAWVRADPNRRLYFRPLPEMNRPGVAWGGANATPASYVGAWVRLRERFARTSLGKEDIQWIWNPNATDVGDVRAERYYPGDSHVEWVGIDGYNFGDSAPWSTWQEPEAVFAPMVERMRALADKPLAIPEFASTSLRGGRYDPPKKAEWIADAFAYVRRERIRMACWFDIDKETDWAVFGGERGTDGYRQSGARYRVYESYRRAANEGHVLEAKPASEGVLSDGTFTGVG